MFPFTYQTIEDIVKEYLLGNQLINCYFVAIIFSSFSSSVIFQLPALQPSQERSSSTKQVLGLHCLLGESLPPYGVNNVFFPDIWFMFFLQNLYILLIS